MVRAEQVTCHLLYPKHFGHRGILTRLDLSLNPCPAILAGGVYVDNTSHYWLEVSRMPEEFVNYQIVHDTQGLFSEGVVTNRPCPTVLVSSKNHLFVERRPSLSPAKASDLTPDAKPPYQVPSMAEIMALSPNGYSIVSTFSGCGGSCLGFKMAGYQVRWASEFVPAAQETYRANHQGTILDTRDIRQVQPADILQAIGKQVGEIDVFEGSPPCASFSAAGKRQEHWGQVKSYSDTRQRTDDLFFEYARLLKGLQPKVFVAENVSGLIKGVSKGYFLRILETLKGCGYLVKSKLLDAQWLGVPQARQRIIFVGVRNDLAAKYGVAPAFPKPFPYRYSVREALPWIWGQGNNAGFGQGAFRDAGQPSPTIGSGPQTGNGNYPPSQVIGLNPDTDISRFAIGKEWDKLRPGESSDKYFSLVKPHPEQPCPTVTAEGGTASLASVAHPIERRKFTIQELKRICAFPDDFILTGSYSQQWERLGRAVPPLMMREVARVIQREILDKCAE